MTIDVLGRIRVRGPHATLEAADLPGRQGRLVLVSLALAERPVAREVLADRVWRGRPVRAWERDLSALVSKLRASVARAGLGDVAITGDAATYELMASDDEVDVRRLRRLSSALHGGAGQTPGGVDRDSLGEVLRLASLPLLAAEDAAWLDDARAELRRLRVEALEAAVRTDLGRGDWQDARRRLHEVLALEPFRESGHRLLMRVELAAGNRAEAIRAYERLRERLADELGVDPSPETETLYLDALRTGSRTAPRATAATLDAFVPDVPPIRYARSGRVSIAYQVVGNGEIDLVLVPGWVSNLELGWHEPRMAGFLRRLAQHCRLILFDKRGTGLSDPIPIETPPPLEVRMDDVRAVMDAADSERAVLLGFSEGGTMSMLFAASHPDRTAGLALWGTWCRQLRDQDFPYGWTREEGRRRFADPIRRDGYPPLRWFAPSMLGDERYEEWFARWARQSASPGMALALLRANAAMDLRPVLPTISAPTLVLHRTDDVLVDVRQGRYLADEIDGAALVEFAGRDHWPWLGDSEPVLTALRAFLQQIAAAPLREADEPASAVLATMVAADLEGADPSLLAPLVEEHRGTLVGSRPDGAAARFDGPGRAVACARAVTERWPAARLAVHTGQLVLDDEVHGPALAIARDALKEVRAGEVVVTRTVTDLVAGLGLAFAARGALERTDLTGSLGLFALV